MGVTHGKKHFPGKSKTNLNGSASLMPANPTKQEDQHPERHTRLQTEEDETSNVIKPPKHLSPLMASRSHQELHKELRMTHRRMVSQEGKSELQRALEKRKWEQRRKASREQEELKRNTSPLHKELLKRQQRLEELESDRAVQREGPEFIRVKERLRRTTASQAAEKEV